jgi:hypothetical protein
VSEKRTVISLLHPDNRCDIDPINVYFPFTSGRLGYDCVSCGAKCCRGYGYSIRSGAEAAVQLLARPALRFFIDAAQPGATSWFVRNSAPSCFFLTPGNECEIHRSHGPGAKPETCRLFPFNSMLLLGTHLIVSPHPTLCPLSVVDGGMRDSKSTHDILLRELASNGIAVRVPLGIVDGDLDATIETERRIVGLSEQFVNERGYDSFAAAQAALSPPADGKVADVTSIASHSDALWAILGAKRPVDDASIARVLIALTPLLRSMCVFRYRGSERLVLIESDRIPYFMASVYALCLLARDAGLLSVTFQSVTQIMKDSRHLLAMLAYAETRVAWRGEAIINLKVDGSDAPRFLRIARALLPRRRSILPPLCDLICQHAPNDELERAAFLKRLAAWLAGRVAPVATEGIGRPRSGAIRLQRLALAHFSEELVLAAIQARRGGVRAPRRSPS